MTLSSRNSIKLFMRILLLISSLVVVPSCIITGEKPKNNSFYQLGSPTAESGWVYLGGLTTDFNSDENKELYSKLDNIGKEINTKFFIVKHPAHCAYFHNKLCWPQDTADEILHTYEYIKNTLENNTIRGFIGFSNGGFFLNKLAQLVELNKPVISIGCAAGHLQGPFSIQNKIYLLISKQDHHHYEYALDFYNKAKKSPLHIQLIEYEGGHVVPIKKLKELLSSLQNC